MISLKIGAVIVAAFIAGAFVSSPELRAYAANTVFSTDIVDGEVKTPDIATGAVTNSKIAPSAVTFSKVSSNSIDSSKIQDGKIALVDMAPNSIDSSKIVDQSIKSSDIGSDAVGASELRGVSKLIFAPSCTITFPDGVGGVGPFDCSAPGATPGDHVLATLQGSWVCGDTPLLHEATVVANDKATLTISFNASCPTPHTVDASVIVYQ